MNANIEDKKVDAKTAEELVYAIMEDVKVDAKTAEVVVCDHCRQKSQCKDFGGTGVCDHGRQKSRCKDCGGSGLCDHGRQRSQCKDCNYFKTCHLCISKHALQKKNIVAYNRNANISRERILLGHINIRSDLVLLGTKMLLLLQ